MRGAFALLRIIAGLIAFLAAALVEPALSPCRAASEIVVTREDGKGGVPLYKASHALVIGIDAYENWPRLHNAIADAKAVAAELAAHGFEVTLKTDLKLRQLNWAIDDFIAEHGGEEDTRLVIWFAGHGHTLKKVYGSIEVHEGYLVPADALDTTDSFQMARSLFSMRRFGEHMREIRSKHVLAVFDSCFSGTIFQVARAGLAQTDFSRLERPVRQFITSGDADQTVGDDGFFRKLFIAALRGEEEQADFDRDGILTGEELGFFLKKRLGILGRQQTPQFGKMAEFGLDRGDIAFRIGPGGSGPGSGQKAAMSEAARVWNYIKDSDEPAVITAFLDLFGKQSPELQELASKRLTAVRGMKEQASRPTSRPEVRKGEVTHTWSWSPSVVNDGNWWLKATRIPSVWPLVATRAANAEHRRTRIALVGRGSILEHRDIAAPAFWGGKREASESARLPPYCDAGRKTHLAGVLAGGAGGEDGINGVLPKRIVDDVIITTDLLLAYPEAPSGTAPARVTMAIDEFAEIAKYVKSVTESSAGNTVVLLTDSYVGLQSIMQQARIAALPEEELRELVIRNMLLEQSKVVGRLAKAYGPRVLFVSPAGDQSTSYDTVDAVWSSIYNYTALNREPDARAGGNFLVVETLDRDGTRPPFSNRGGHVAAPGIDIMSTSAASQTAYGLCSSTVTSAGVVAGIAAMIWDLNPALTSTQIKQALRESALPPLNAGDAPRVDAMAAVNWLSKKGLAASSPSLEKARP